MDGHNALKVTAYRELLKRGLAAEEFKTAPAGSKSQSFGVLERIGSGALPRGNKGGGDRGEG